VTAKKPRRKKKVGERISLMGDHADCGCLGGETTNFRKLTEGKHRPKKKKRGRREIRNRPGEGDIPARGNFSAKNGGKGSWGERTLKHSG